MKQLTAKEYKKLASIELSANRYMNRLKKFNCENSVLLSKKNQWLKLAEKFGILRPDGDVRYTTECGKDYSHGYNFGDVLA